MTSFTPAPSPHVLTLQGVSASTDQDLGGRVKEQMDQGYSAAACVPVLLQQEAVHTMDGLLLIIEGLATNGLTPLEARERAGALVSAWNRQVSTAQDLLSRVEEAPTKTWWQRWLG